MLLALDSPHTPHPWWPLLGSSDPESDTPSSTRVLSRAQDAEKCADLTPPESSPLPRSGKSMMPLHIASQTQPLGRAGIQNPADRYKIGSHQ